MGAERPALGDAVIASFIVLPSHNSTGPAGIRG
jgi:hypothetical protein